jgi:V/A-type H+-transporting ATPase subunit G/H
VQTPSCVSHNDLRPLSDAWKKGTHPMKNDGSTNAPPDEGPSTASADLIAYIRAAETGAEERIQGAHRRAREIIQAAQNEAHEHRKQVLEQARTAAQKACERALDQAEAQIHAIDRETDATIIELRSQAQLHTREARSLVVSAVQE